MNRMQNRTHRSTAGVACRALAGAALVAAITLMPAAAFAQATYVWAAGTGYFPWSDPASWSPPRVTPLADDILVIGALIGGGGLSEVDVDVSDTIGQLIVSGNHQAKITSLAGSVALTISGGPGLDLHVESGCTLELDGLTGGPMSLVLGTGATGQVDASAVVISTMGNGRILATDAGSLHFLSGSRMETNPPHSGSVFGSTGAAGTVVFESGSMYLFRSGANPFGLAAPNSKVVWQTGSVYRHESGAAPALTNRTYADFEFAAAGTVNMGGTTVCTMDNLRVFSGTMNVNAAQPLLIKRDLAVNTGSSLNYSPPIAGATMTFGGTAVQSISCPNNVELGITGFNLGANATVTTTAGHPGLTVAAGDLNPTMTFSPQTKVTCTGTGRVIMGPSATLSPGAGAWIDGPLGLRVATGGPVNVTYPVGYALVRSDVALSFAGVSTAGYLIVQTFAGDHPALSGSGLDVLKSVNRWWRVQPGTGLLGAPTFSPADATLSYDLAEFDPGATPANFVVGKRDGATWTLPAHGAGTFTSIQATGLTSFSDFAVGEPSSCPTITVLPGTLPGGTTGTPYAETLTASGGTAPHTFAVTFGSLPPGLTLASGGALTGTPTSSGTFDFTVTATDAFSCTGNRAYSVDIGCPTITLSPSTLPDAGVGVAYSQTVTASGGAAPYSFTEFGSGLPPGITLSSAGALTGTPTTAGTYNFTIVGVDAFGCSGLVNYALDVVTGDKIEPGPAPSCIAVATPCVLVPVVFSRINTTPALAYSVTVQLSPELALCGPGFSSAGYLPPGSGGTVFLVTAAGPNTWTVDESTLGPPCGVTGSGTLFYVHVTSSGPPTGTGTVTVIATSVRDCSNAPIPGAAGSPATVNVDLAAPAAVADLSATQQKTGNDADGTTRIALAFTGPLDASSTQVWRKGFGGYPQYDENGGAAPAAPASPMDAAGAGWTLTGVAASGQSDEPATRDVWSYVVYSLDACGNVSAVSNMTGGTLNYHLGDAHNSVTACAGDNQVATPDVSFLGANYFSIVPLNGALECLDVGPTTNLSPDARPTTDNVLNFEDLILVGINYGQVSAPSLAATPAITQGAGSALWVEAPARVAAGERVRALVRMRGAGDLQGLSAQLGWNAAVVEPLGFESGGWIEGDGGVVFGAGPGGVDATLLGVRGRGIGGEGTLAIVTFEARAAGAPGIRVARAEGRDPANRRVSLGGAPGAIEAGAPSRTAIDLAFPNPFTRQTSVQLSLARSGRVKLVAFDLGGRRVRTLMEGELEAGTRAIIWDGRSDAGVRLAPGAYVLRLEAGEIVQSRQVSIVR